MSNSTPAKPIDSDLIKTLFDYDKLIADILEDIKHDIKKSAKDEVLLVLGLNFDRWGRLESIDDEFRNKLLKDENIKKFRDNLIESVKNNILTYDLDSEKRKSIVEEFIYKIERDVLHKEQITLMNNISEIINTELKKAISKYPEFQEYFISQL